MLQVKCDLLQRSNNIPPLEQSRFACSSDNIKIHISLPFLPKMASHCSSDRRNWLSYYRTLASYSRHTQDILNTWNTWRARRCFSNLVASWATTYCGNWQNTSYTVLQKIMHPCLILLYSFSTWLATPCAAVVVVVSWCSSLWRCTCTAALEFL